MQLPHAYIVATPLSSATGVTHDSNFVQKKNVLHEPRLAAPSARAREEKMGTRRKDTDAVLCAQNTGAQCRAARSGRGPAPLPRWDVSQCSLLKRKVVKSSAEEEKVC